MRLKVTSIKYKSTHLGGISYVAKTNADGVEIVNEGVGLPTFLHGLWRDIKPFYSLKEGDLEKLVSAYTPHPQENTAVIGTLTIDYKNN